MKVGIIDYGVGNLGSVSRSLEELEVEAILIDKSENIHLADVLILPGVGGFTECMTILNNQGWTDQILYEVLDNNKPILGICLGMQLLADYGQEGASSKKLTKGLGLVPGKVISLESLGCELRIPHVGWNSIKIIGSPKLFDSIPEDTDFYFVHSYAFDVTAKESLIATFQYGVEVTAAINHNHIWGTQFHPEKSSRAGFRLLKNFIHSNQC
ncbi:imidazole glycerol phosphate synthase subunit HisH [Candidatus Pseudothioglobus singularis]|jgi:imidazole glycerol-phosphate synthase subunit HisH|nr:imidazole glycerol phosphate synthase subunit HisH [Candidatus Pseudothioglobus singularis]